LFYFFGAKEKQGRKIISQHAQNKRRSEVRTQNNKQMPGKEKRIANDRLYKYGFYTEEQLIG
jgi:hypothetical protein